MKYLLVSLAFAAAACGSVPGQDPNSTPPPLGEPTEDTMPQVQEMCEAEPDAAFCEFICIAEDGTHFLCDTEN